MIKLMLLMRRRPGTSREDFRSYYEGNHAPLAASVMSRCVKYVRNFVSEEPTGPQDFDAITEFWFEIEGPYSVNRHQLADKDVQSLLAEDEARFMDRTSMRVIVVEEQETPADRLLGNREPGASSPR